MTRQLARPGAHSANADPGVFGDEPQFVPLYPAGGSRRAGRRSGRSGGGPRTGLGLALALAVLAGGAVAYVHFSQPVNGQGTAAKAPTALGATAFPSAKAAPHGRTAPTNKQLAAINIQPADLPGWSTSPSDSSDGGSAPTGLSSSCTALLAKLGASETIESDSPYYESGNVEVSSSAATMKTTAAVAADVKTVKSASFPACVQQLDKVAAQSLVQGGRIGTISTRQLPRFAGEPASVVVVLRVTVTITAPHAATIYVDAGMIASGWVETNFEVDGFNQLMTPSTENHLIATLGQRTAAA